MVEINQRERTIRVKLVYYGPPLGGKTTNLTALHNAAFWARRGELTSVNSAQDRTILYDLLPLKGEGFRGFDLRLSLIAVPGQSMYAASRRVALRGADGVVFVANSAADRWDENIQSYKEMAQHLQSHMIDPVTIPLVLQYNKRDLPEVMPVESLDKALNGRGVERVVAVAARGEGVLETFRAALLSTMAELARRFRTVEMPHGKTSEQWVDDTIRGIFGRASLARKPGPMEPAIQSDTVPSSFEPLGESVFELTPEPPVHRKVRIARPEDAPRPEGTPAPAASGSPELLVESYAQASAELGTALADVREERNRALARLEQVRRALEVGDEIGTGHDVVAGLGRGLRVLLQAAGASLASFVVPAAGAGFRAILPPAPDQDLLAGSAAGLRCLEARRNELDPVLLAPKEDPAFDEALEAVGRRFTAAALIPLRSPAQLLGLVVLYYAPDSAQADPETLRHLGLLARILRTPLELALERAAV